MAKITVYCTARNERERIPAMIKSVQWQTIQDWQLIVVDDGSTDDTAVVVRKAAEKDARIRLIETGGIGRGPALNLALEAITTPFAANLDSDDQAHPKRLALQLSAFEQCPEYSVIAANSLFATEPLQLEEWESVSERVERSEIRDVTHKLVTHNPINHSSMMARTESLRNVGGYCEERSSQLDYDLWTRMMMEGYRLGKIPYPLAVNRIHSNQFYEASDHLLYVWRSLGIQARAIRMERRKFWLWGMLPLRLMWGIVPRDVRMKVRNRMRNTHGQKEEVEPPEGE